MYDSYLDGKDSGSGYPQYDALTTIEQVKIDNHVDSLAHSSRPRPVLVGLILILVAILIRIGVSAQSTAYWTTLAISAVLLLTLVLFLLMILASARRHVTFRALMERHSDAGSLRELIDQLERDRELLRADLPGIMPADVRENLMKRAKRAARREGAVVAIIVMLLLWILLKPSTKQLADLITDGRTTWITHAVDLACDVFMFGLIFAYITLVDRRAKKQMHRMLVSGEL